ncbi:substrate-binding domain-containing protein [Pseudonocardia terrae]|uniref:substrate-binding domain-containing protein n=1 Tax=Pseudonocardia terrae TaxID=2905831 RepID=UPI0035571305
MFCANDLLAIGVLNACMRRRIAVPDELSVVGYDDIDFAETASVALTTVGQPGRRLGQEAVQLLLAEVGGAEGAEGADGTAPGSPRNLVFRPELVVRSSTRAADVRLTAGPSAS